MFPTLYCVEPLDVEILKNLANRGSSRVFLILEPFLFPLISTGGDLLFGGLTFVLEVVVFVSIATMSCCMVVHDPLKMLPYSRIIIVLNECEIYERLVNLNVSFFKLVHLVPDLLCPDLRLSNLVVHMNCLLNLFSIE